MLRVRDGGGVGFGGRQQAGCRGLGASGTRSPVPHFNLFFYLEHDPHSAILALMTQYRIGIDLGGTKIEVAALAPDGTEVARHRIATPRGYDATLDGIAAMVRDTEARLGRRSRSGSESPA